MEKITTEVLNELENNVSNWEWVKSRVICRLGNRDANKENLKDCPSMPANVYIKELNDLIISFHVFISSDNGEAGTIKVTNEFMEKWEQSLTKEFCDMAIANTERLLPMDLRKLSDILGFDEEEENEIYVCSNKLCNNGAASVLFPNFLPTIKKIIKSENIILIPSSIHEWIILGREGQTQSGMDSMVQDVNKGCVSSLEILSDHVYYLDLDLQLVKK